MPNLKQLGRHDDELSIRLFPSSPIGPIMITTSSEGLTLLSIITDDDFSHILQKTANSDSARIADMAVSQVGNYFSGKLVDFTLPLDLMHVTDFQREVLMEAVSIPFGKVRTYGDVAISIGRPRAARAVGGALGRNPIGIIIPCHRVVAYDGHLHGYSTPQGIRTKAALLEHEGVRVVGDRVMTTEA